MEVSARVQRKMAAEVQMQTAARLWEGLIRECKADPHTRHVYVLLKEKKKALRARAKFTRETASSSLEELEASGLAMLTGVAAFASLEWSNVFKTLTDEQLETLTDDDRLEMRHRLKVCGTGSGSSRKVFLTSAVFR